jgi:hypothetical protein
MPNWAVGRLNAVIVMLSQAATALGGAIWGAAATSAGIDRTLITTAFVAILFLAFVHVVLRKRLSIDFTVELNLEPATMTPFSHDLDPTRLTQAKENPISLIWEFHIDPARRGECMELMRQARMIYLRNGAHGWHLYEDLKQSNLFQMEVVLPSGREVKRQHERMTQDEHALLENLSRLRIGPREPVELPRVCVDREVLQKRPKP